MIFRDLETGLSYTDGAWQLFQAVNSQFVGNSFQPQWAPAPLLTRAERTAPQLGWPRSTDSLCSRCVQEMRRRILSGEQSADTLVNEHVGEIEAHILERDGKIHRREDMPPHGTFTDTLAMSPEFLERIEWKASPRKAEVHRVLACRACRPRRRRGGRTCDFC